MATDLTRRNVIRQLDAMGVEDFEIGVLVPEQGEEDAKMMLREWDRDTLLKSLGWLKGQNASGNHIFIRPNGSQGLIFMDDLNVSSLMEIERAGIKPAAVVESSPLNFQAWVRVSNEPIDADLASAIGRTLARRFRGDPNSTDWRHFGRLVGFTNRKPQYVNDSGHFPFVKLSESTTRAGEHIDSDAIVELVKAGKVLLEEERAAQLAEIERLKAARNDNQTPYYDLKDPTEFYRSELHGLMGRFGKKLDLSLADWTIGKNMREKGYVAEQVMIAILEASPSLNSRKSGHVEDYVRRTVNKLYGLDAA
ncbi:MAG: DNA-primase RepB domain-containing protein [Pseudomonadota bacterium]